MSDKNIRQQFVESLDVGKLIRNNLGRLGIPAHSLIPPGLPGYEPAQKLSGKSTKEKPHLDLELTCMIHPVFDGPYSTLLKGFVAAIGEIKLTGLEQFVHRKLIG